MRKFVVLLALACAFAIAPVIRADAVVTKHWTITNSAVGPLDLGESLAGLHHAGFSFYACGTRGGHPCYFRGALGRANVQFDVDAHDKIKEIMVNEASGAGYAFATEHGVAVGSTLTRLKNREHVRYVEDYGYGPAYVVHRAGTRRWITFFALGTAPTSKVYSIVVSNYANPIQGR